MAGLGPTPAMSQTNPQDGEDPVLSLDEAVRFLNSSKPTLYRLLRQGDIRALRAGRQWRFRRSDLVAYLQRDTIAEAAPAGVIQEELAYFARETTGRERAETKGEASDPLAALTGTIIADAIYHQATDIHFEPARLDGESVALLRYRLDGVLHEIRRMAVTLHDPLVQRLKQMAEMHIAERRVPQDGRFRTHIGSHEYDLRISTVPTLYGEALTMRVLDRAAVLVGLDNLGIYPDDLARIRTALGQPRGTIVTTGPTGSGKSTLLYSCLAELADGHYKVMSVEDPVEFQLPYVTQTSVNRKVGYNFPAALRSFLRSDPDVVMSSEVRDLETAELLTEISLTGHLVLTALHPNSAPETFRRLIDMGVEPFLVAQTVILAIGQRLVRRICPNCLIPENSNDAAGKLAELRIRAAAGGYQIPDNTIFYRGAGCDECRRTGFRGRLGVFEVIPVHPRMMDAIIRNAPADEIAQLARGISPGVRSLVADGARKAVDKLTTVEEVLRVAPSEL